MFYNSQNQTEARPHQKYQAKSLVGVLLILVAVSFYVFAVKPISDEVTKKSEELVTRVAEASVLQKKVDDFKKQEGTLQLNEEKKRQILSAIPIGINQDEVIRDIVDVAAKRDITLRSISFSKSTSADQSVNVLRVSASFEGSYSDLINFLQGIEGNQRRFKINSISVQVNSENLSMSDRVSFSLTMDSFYQD